LNIKTIIFKIKKIINKAKRKIFGSQSNGIQNEFDIKNLSCFEEKN
jgi:hypothetical protein